MKKSNKNKRFGLIALVIVLIVIVGVGYAVSTTDTLYINGTVNAQASDLYIEFNNTSTITPTVTKKKADTSYTIVPSATCTYGTTSTADATMKVEGLKYITTDKKTGDSAVCTFEILNASDDLDADITCALDTDNSDYDSDYYDIAIEMSDNTSVAPYADDTSAIAKAKVTVTLKKSYKKSDTIKEQTFKIKCTGEEA